MMRSVILILIFSCHFSWSQNPPAGEASAENTNVNGKENPAESSPSGAENNGMFDMAPQIEYVYDPTGKKDPFKPYKAPRVRGDNRPTAPTDPLALVEVSQLRLVAVLWNTPKPRAVVKDSLGRSFILFKNMRIGRNEGVVVDIREGEIVIVEKFDDGFGNTVREARVLEMNVPDPSAASAGG